MNEEIPRKIGAPRNQYPNPWFLSKILDEREQLDYKHAMEVEGMDEKLPCCV